jgi:hypothetical protein
MSSSGSMADIPIIDPLRHLFDNYEKLREFEEYERKSEGGNKKSLVDAQDLKNFMLVQIME